MNRSRRFFIKDTELSGKLRMQERTVARCGFCSMLSGLLRRAMCVSSRRDSSESYYRELGDQDTLIEDRVSELSDNVDIQDEEQTRLEVHPQPEEEVLQIETVMKPKSLADGRFLTIHKRRKKSLLTRSLENNCALLDDLSLGQVQCILNQSVTWRFNAFTLDVVSGGRCLPVLCMHLFHMYGLYTHFKLDVAKTWKLFSMIEERYHSTNPYHNSIHAADVTQAMHCFLQQDRIRDHLQPLEILASLLAAIAHDMDHPGVNQPFLIATSNHLATLYQNTSVLENHHWRSAISCLIESGILDQMQETRPALEKQISSLILATDITRQQEFLCQFKRYLDSSTLDMTKAEHRHLVLQIALKCADISNPCRSWEISQKWSLKVCEEFFRQGDYERKLNLPVSALCDRHSTSIPKIQTGFFKFVVTPLIKEWDRFLKNDLSSQMLSNLLYNQNKWDSLVAEELAREESSNEISDADMVDYDLDTRSGTSNSESSELLLPPRRCSLNPTKPGGLRDELRRFSVPLNIFQDTKFKTRGDSNRAHLLVGLQRGDNASHPGSSQGTQETPEKVLSTENLLPDSSIASITTPVQATRLSTVIRDCGNWKLVRQQTFPPLEPARDHPPSRSLHTSNEDTISHVKADLPRFDLTSCRKDGKFSNLFTRLGTDKTDNIAAGSQTNVESAEPRRSVHKESETKRRKSVEVGSQLRDNLTSVQLGGLDSDHLLRRRTSMPADVITLTSKEKKGRELAAVLPQFLCRTVTGKDSWTHRRGSAPSPIAPSEMRGLASLGALCHSTNGGRRKPNPLATCQQWLTKATYNVQETFQHMPRRSSLPVEVYRPAESGRTTDKPK